MDDWTGDDNGKPPKAKRPRVVKACGPCRAQKLRCDLERPCTRCLKNGIECIYVENPKDPVTARFETIEAELTRLNQLVNSAIAPQQQISTAAPQPFRLMGSNSDGFRPSTYQDDPQVAIGGLGNFIIRGYSGLDVITMRTVSEEDAGEWFAAFFEGCDRFVPIFDADDTYASVRKRSSILFDIIVVYGARAAHGVLSKSYQALLPLLRRHSSDLILRLTGPPNDNIPIEEIQAILVIASYSESGAIFCDVALRAAIRARIPTQLDAIFESYIEQRCQGSHSSQPPFAAARVWYYLYVLDMILSVDGGKPPSIILRSPRRVRPLLSHPKRTILDIRLLAQVELNAIRSAAHVSIHDASANDDAEEAVNGITTGALIDLDQWLSDWQGITMSESTLDSEHGVIDLNMRIQHTWAILALHLRALTASGADNIALMTDSQQRRALLAKVAAEYHLRLLLTNNSESHQGTDALITERSYVKSFRYAMEFVWAKNAFCVLILLRLSLLLKDPPDRLKALVADASEFIRGFNHVGVASNIRYTRILSKTLEKCEKAIQTSLEARNGHHSAGSSDGDDFESFIPKEFIFEWDFPGLNLCYIELDWQDLFLNFETTEV